MEFVLVTVRALIVYGLIAQMFVACFLYLIAGFIDLIKNK